MILGIVARQAPLSTGFSRQEHWSGLSFSPPGDLSDPGIEPISPLSPELESRLFTTEPPGKSIEVEFGVDYIINTYII